MAADKIGLLMMEDSKPRFVVLSVNGNAFQVDQVFIDRDAAIAAAALLVTTTSITNRVWVAGVGDEIVRSSSVRHALP